MMKEYFKVIVTIIVLNIQFIILGQDISIQMGHNAPVNVLQFAPEGNILASGGTDNLIVLWDLNTKKQLSNLIGHTSTITSIVFHPNKNIIASSSDDKSVRIWESPSGKLLKVFKFSTSVKSVSFKPNGQEIACGAKYVYVINLRDNTFNKISKRAKNRYDCIDYSENGELLAYGGKKENKTKVVNTNGYALFQSLSFKSKKLAFNKDKSLIAIGSNGVLKKWIFVNRKFKTNFTIPTKSFKHKFNCFAFNDSIIFAGNKDKIISLFSQKEGKTIKRIKGHISEVQAIATNKNANIFASAGIENAIILWNLNDLNIANVLVGYGNRVNDIKLENHGKSIIIGFNNGDFSKYSLDILNDKYQNKAYTLKKNLLFNWQHTIDSISNWSSNNNEVIFSTRVRKNDPKRIGQYSIYQNYKVKWNYQTNTIHKEKLGRIKKYKNYVETVDKLIAYSNNFSTIVEFTKDSLLTRNTKENKVLYSIPAGHSDKITSLQIDSQRNLILTGGWDGKVIFRDLSNGKKLFTIIPLKNEYLYILPSNFYYASKGSYKAIGFQMNDKILPFEQFDLKYNRPDIIMERIGLTDSSTIQMYRRAYYKRLQKSGFNEKMFNSDWHIPSIVINNKDKLPVSTDKNNITLDVLAKDSKYNLDRINVWVNDVPIYGMNGINLKNKETSQVLKTLNVALSEGENKIQVSTHNNKAVESYKETVYVNYKPKKQEKPDLYFVAIGISEYENSINNLEYADDDAKDLINLFKNKKDIYKNVHIIPLLNLNATKKNILAIKDSLVKTKVDDEVIIFYAGHGVFGEDDNYYLANTDIDNLDISATALAYDDFEALLDGIPSRKKLLFIDACHSGEADDSEEFVPEILLADISADEGNRNIKLKHIKRSVYGGKSKLSKPKISKKNSFELMKHLFADLRRGTGATIISSAGSGEFALEGGVSKSGKVMKNGVFTFVMKKALNDNKADKNKDGKITVTELRDYVFDKVAKYTGGRQHPTARRENLAVDFRVW